LPLDRDHKSKYRLFTLPKVVLCAQAQASGE
jgi:hypothetical protein